MGFHTEKCSNQDMVSPRLPFPSRVEDTSSRGMHPQLEVMYSNNNKNDNNNNNNNHNNINARGSLQLPPVARASQSLMTSLMTSTSVRQTPDINIEEVEDHIKPVYLRDSTIYKAYVKQKEKQNHEQLIAMTTQGIDTYQPVQQKPKWKVCEPDLNAWRENTIDSRNLYSVTVDDLGSLDDFSDDDFVEDAELDAIERRDDPTRGYLHHSSHDNLLRSDSTHQRERSYIRDSRTSMRSPEMTESRRFWAQTIREYNRPTQTQAPTPYCSPKNSLVRQDSKELLMRNRKVPVESVTRVPPHLRILPRLLRGEMCQKQECLGKQFCDVLGPETCMECIEFANRRVAGEVQRQAFPGLDCTVSTLVAPTLSRYLLGGGDGGGDGGGNGDGGGLSRAAARTGHQRALVSRSLDTGGSTRLPTITESARFGRAGVERGWEEKARRYSSGYGLVPPPMFLM